MVQKSTSLFIERVDEKAWLFDLEGKPELICINGPYINQRIVKEMYGDLPKDQIVLHATPTTHHDAHWDHPPRRARTSPTDGKKVLNSKGEVKDDCTFMMQDDLKMREERNGLLISQNNTAYFVNNEGAFLLKLIGNRVQVGDIETLCEKHGISNTAGMEFFRRLVTFGLYRPI